jgi:pimeloyl-ACP methyl ester carboxylesterase
MLSPWQWIMSGTALFGISLPMAGFIYEARAERRDAEEKTAPGQMVDVGGHRLHLHCKGAGGPTVVIEQGAAEPARLWRPIQDRVAQFAHVCTYDRAGYGWSDTLPAGRSVDDRVDDLHALLENAHLPGPFVFVAHSYGGLIVRRYAERHPHLTAGLVLVDTAEEGAFFRPEVLKFYSRVRGMFRVVQLAARLGLLRLLAGRYSLDEFGLPFVRAHEYAAAIDDFASLEKMSPDMRKSKDSGMFGDLPLAVITHGQPFPGPLEVVERGWHDGQVRLAALSTAGELTVAANSNHMIQHDEPDVVLDVIRRVHAAARRLIF